MAKGKILFLITELDIGGAEKNLFRLACGLTDRGWEVAVGALSGTGEVGKWLEAAGIPVHYIRMDRKTSPAGFLRLVRVIRRFRPDILHTFLFHANIAGRLANIFCRVPAVVSSIRVAERRRPSHLRMDRLTQPLVDLEICVSEGVREFTRKRARVSPEKLAVIPNPVEPSRPAKSRDQVRRAFDVAQNDTLVLSVGRLDLQKGYTYLVEAAPEVLRRYPQAVFLVAGEGPERSRLQGAITSAGIADRFRLPGWRADVADLYGAADIFVLPSLWEGMPNALLEAAAAGLPVVATDVEGSREVVEDGSTGLLARAADPDSLAEALVTLLSQPGLAGRLAEAGRTRVLSQYDPAKFLQAHEQIYFRLLSV